jgi:hypothetical protein
MVDVMPLDFWNLFVQNVAGSFVMAVVLIALIIYIIMGFLGRVSIYSVTVYCLMFLLAMGLGYGYVTVNILITLGLIIGFIYSITSYLNSK